MRYNLFIFLALVVAVLAAILGYYQGQSDCITPLETKLVSYNGVCFFVQRNKKTKHAIATRVRCIDGTVEAFE